MAVFSADGSFVHHIKYATEAYIAEGMIVSAPVPVPVPMPVPVPVPVPVALCEFLTWWCAARVLGPVV